MIVNGGAFAFPLQPVEQVDCFFFFHESIWTSLVRPEAPTLMETAAFGQWKWSATNATSSALALPSTGGAFSLATHVPSGICSRDETFARGFTLIWSTVFNFQMPNFKRQRPSLKPLMDAKDLQGGNEWGMDHAFPLPELASISVH